MAVNNEEIEIIVFSLLGEELGLEVSYVRELLIPHEIHPLPRMPGFIDGVIDLRGHIIAVMDLRKKFNCKKRKLQQGKHVIICKIKNIIVGLNVDSVNEIAVFSRTEIQPVPVVISKQTNSSYIAGIIRSGKRVITLLNLEEVLTNKEITGLIKVK